ncbi:hypothetical protein AB0F71_28835 [Kitasatospora sp. NPDC028055]|uniref:hypothetical protein n=1 Tax=Kitasatospora sp. NPDC028055 TaxID=3155653 RepID=UPI0033FD4342
MFSIESNRLHRFVAGAVAAAGAIATVSAFAVAGTANAATEDSAADRGPKPTVVLEHGAFADGSSVHALRAPVSSPASGVASP